MGAHMGGGAGTTDFSDPSDLQSLVTMSERPAHWQGAE
jgi:hypothetical protein